MPHLTIGKLAERTEISTDTLRYWEKIELLKPGTRSATGYRMYHYDTVRVVRFIRSAQALHFSLEDIRELLSLNASDPRSCKRIMKQTEVKIHEAQRKITELQAIKNTLASLVEKDSGGKRTLMEHIQGSMRMVGLCLSALVTALCDPAYAQDASALFENEAVRMEEPFKRSKILPAC